MPVSGGSAMMNAPGAVGPDVVAGPPVVAGAAVVAGDVVSAGVGSAADVVGIERDVGGAAPGRVGVPERTGLVTVVEGPGGVVVVEVVDVEVVDVVDVEVVDVDVEVDVVDVEVVVVLVVVVVGGALGSGGPLTRGVPMNSKCMPSAIGKLPPQANPLRRNTSTMRGSIEGMLP